MLAMFWRIAALAPPRRGWDVGIEQLLTAGTMEGSKVRVGKLHDKCRGSTGRLSKERRVCYENAISGVESEE
jgi:hypothetical protein